MDKVKRIIGVIAIIMMVACIPAFSKEQVEEDISLRTYFTLIELESHKDYVKAVFSFKDEESYVLFSDNGIVFPETSFLSSSEIASILAETWYIQTDEFKKTLEDKAAAVLGTVKEHLDGVYPFVGEVSAKKADDASKEMLTVTLAPFQNYNVSYFNLANGLIDGEVDYFGSKYSFGANVSYINRFTEDFGVGMGVGANLTFDEGYFFLNASLMFDFSAVMLRLGRFEVLTTIGYGGFVTLNETTVSFIPGMEASVGLCLTADESTAFVLSTGMDLGLWLWKNNAATGFAMYIQKPIMFGVGIRL